MNHKQVIKEFIDGFQGWQKSMLMMLGRSSCIMCGISTHKLKELREAVLTLQKEKTDKKNNCKHPLNEKGTMIGWAHSRSTSERDLLLAMHENLMKIGKLIEQNVS